MIGIVWKPIVLGGRAISQSIVSFDEEADDLVKAERHERAASREAHRAGHHERKLTTASGQVTVATLKAVHAQESREAPAEKAAAVVAELRSMKLAAAARAVEGDVPETLPHTGFPMGHRPRIRTNDPIEGLSRAMRRRTSMADTFPDGHAALMLVTARPEHVADSVRGSRRHLDVSLLEERPCRRPHWGLAGKRARFSTAPPAIRKPPL